LLVQSYSLISSTFLIVYTYPGNLYVFGSVFSDIVVFGCASCVLFNMLFSCSIKKIASKVSVQQKNVFISHLHGYWQLKRQSLNGVPLRRATRVSARQVIRSRVRLQYTVYPC